MKFPARQKVYPALATVVVFLHLGVAAIAKPSFPLTMYGDASPCVLLLLAILATRENFRRPPGILSLFWKLFAAGFLIMLFSQAYWFYYDWRRPASPASPIPGDSLFLLSQVFFLTALALRPHSSSAGRDLRTRFLDFLLLALWWFSLYGYFCLPWQVGRQDFAHYNPSYYVLALIQHLIIIAALAALCLRQTSTWRSFYMQSLLAFLMLAGGNLLISVSIDAGSYYAGDFYDTPLLVSLYMFTVMAGLGPSLQPQEESRPNRELTQSLWTARFAMLSILSLPVIALLGLFETRVPPDIAGFRLRVVFVAMLLLGALVYLKLGLLTRELGRMVSLTHESIENLKVVQQQVAHSEKLVALGHLAAGAAHEISNPLTAIFGYSELLTDIPSLSPEDRGHAQLIQQQVHRAQAAVISLRDTLRQNPSPAPFSVDKKPAS